MTIQTHSTALESEADWISTLGTRTTVYKKIVALPFTRRMSGDVFKAYGQPFNERISIQFVPTVRVGGSKLSINLSGTPR